MPDALDDHAGTISIGGRVITNLQLANDIDGLAGNEEELNELSKGLDRAAKAFSMEINTEKTKVLTNNVEGIRGDIRINDKRLEIVNHLKSLSGIVTDEGTKPEIQSRIVEATHEISQLKIIWKDKNTSLQTKIRLIHIALLSIFSMNLKHGPSLMICKKEYRSGR